MDLRKRPLTRSEEVPRLPAPPAVGFGATTTDPIGEQTRADVFAAILTAGPLSRTQVAQRLGLSASTVTKVVNPLVAADYLVETGETASRPSGSRRTGPGRPQKLLQVNETRHVVVGVKLAPHQVTGVLTDMRAQTLARTDRPLEDRAPAAALDAAAKVVAELLTAIPNSADRVLGVGVGVGGDVDAAQGICRYSGLLGWEKVDLAGPLWAATGLPIVVNNDVNTLVVAERWFGAGRDVDSFAVVTIGAGVGCGLLINGTLHAGASGLAGELGHIPLQPDGPECSCGNRGCLEALASYNAVLREISRRGGPDHLDIASAIQLARAGAAGGDAGEIARAAFASAGDALGRGLAVLCNLLNLEKIILAGEGVTAHDLFGPALAASLDRHAFSTAARDCELLVDVVDDDLWARGAACLVIRHAVRASL